MAAAEVINIVSKSGSKAKFDPPDLVVQQGDVVSWNNKTGRVHELAMVNQDGTLTPLPIGGPIARRDQSDAFTVTQSLQYRCTRHAGETGTITMA
jgi:plastocyanin